MDIETLIDAVIAREGDYSDHPADRGGATCWGISEAVARANGYRGEMRNYPRVEAEAIYRRLYWERPGFARLAKFAPSVAQELFDSGVNLGPAAAISFLKRALNAMNRNGADYADVDAVPLIDDASLAALQSFLAKRGPAGEAVLLKALDALQGERYVHIAETRPVNEAFLYGWFARRISHVQAANFS